LTALQDAALARCREIILRDIDPQNRDKTIYRGVARTIANYYRMTAFCRRIGRHCSEEVTVEVREALVGFIRQELSDFQSGRRASSINAEASIISYFLQELGYDPAHLPSGWIELCP
jgi:hypothetical protein